MGGGIIYFHDLFRGTYCIEAGLSKIGIFLLKKKRNNIVSIPLPCSVLGEID